MHDVDCNLKEGICEIDGIRFRINPSIAHRFRVVDISDIRVVSVTPSLTDEEFTEWKDSLPENITFGPIVLKEYDGKRYLKDGEHRLRLIKEKGATKAPSYVW